MTHPGRTVTVRERGVRRGASASRPDHFGPRTRHRSSKPNLRELGGRHEVQLLRGLPKFQRLCSSTGKSKRLISARLVVQLHPQPPEFFLRQRSTKAHSVFRNYFVILCFFVADNFCGVAKLVRHRTVNAEMRRFESFRHSQSIDPELEGQSSGLLSREVRV